MFLNVVPEKCSSSCLPTTESREIVQASALSPDLANGTTRTEFNSVGNFPPNIERLSFASEQAIISAVAAYTDTPSRPLAFFHKAPIRWSCNEYMHLCAAA